MPQNLGSFSFSLQIGPGPIPVETSKPNSKQTDKQTELIDKYTLMKTLH